MKKPEKKTADTLYYNAFTEDLFYWDNDLENDTDRFLKLNSDSRFFSGLKELEMESRIRPFLHRYADFDFTIDYDEYKISFYRNVTIEGVSPKNRQHQGIPWRRKYICLVFFLGNYAVGC